VAGGHGWPEQFPTPTAARRDGLGFAPVSTEGDVLAGARSPEELFEAIVESVRSIVLADRRTIELAVGCLLADGHLLVEDLPGLGKTTLAKALAHALGLGFLRVQFTADLLPADVTGAMVLDPATRQPVFREGPIFTNLLMADELNRASPRAQSALLEAMEERQVTVDGRSLPLPSPFWVVATQNPYDAAGTSPLPHGQRDRFLVRLSLGYPERADEEKLLAGIDPAVRVGHLPGAVDRVELDRLTTAVAAVHVAATARNYVLDLVAATRDHPSVRVGASPRAALALLRMARAMAVADGRSFVSPDDVQVAAGPTLAHRVLLDIGAEVTGRDAAGLVDELVEMVPVPLVDASEHRPVG
jgi:MoxR-like ATPase